MRAALTLLLAFQVLSLSAQYISTCQTPTNDCPTVCPGGILTVEVFQIQNLNNGDTVQMILSNASGSFASGTTKLNFTAYSTNQGTSWTNGPYIWSGGGGTVTNLYVEVTIPVTQPQGAAYTCYIYAPSNAGNSPQLFRCNEPTGVIQVIAAWPTIAESPINTWGVNQWIAGVYTYTPSVPGSDSMTAADIAATNFFVPANYQGDFLKDSLSFDIDWLTGEGGIAPGSPGVLNDGTSIPCSGGFVDDFSIIFLRKQNFAPGLYTLSIQGDDGIRLSIDSGQTWLLSSWFQQKYGNSFQSTSTANPNGICLSGNTDLYIEYFQHLVDAHATFKATLLTPPITNPDSVTICAGQNTSFTTTSINGFTYQWLYSPDGGTNYYPAPANAIIGGVTTNTLTITGAPAGYNGYLFECQITGLCSNPDTTSAALLTISGGNDTITTQPADTSSCNGVPVSFSIGVAGTTPGYQWQVNTGSGFTNITNGGIYSGATSATLNISSTTAGMNGYQYRCIVTGGCAGGSITSNTATLTVGNLATITTQPQNDTVCAGSNAIFSTAATNASGYAWQMNTGGGFQDITPSATYQNPTTTQLTVVSATAAMSGTQFQCSIQSSCGDTLTTIVTLIVLPAPVITSEPTDVHLCDDTAANFQVVVSGPASSYQWQVNMGSGFTNVTNGGIYSGATSSILSLNPGSLSMTGYQYKCVITGCGGNIDTSTIATITSGGLTTINTQPGNDTICEDANAVFTVQATNAVGYQWEMNTGSGFQPITANSTYQNPTTPQLTVNNVTTQMSGTQFQCMILKCGGDTLSQTVTLIVEPSAIIFAPPADVRVCSDTTITFQVTVNGTATGFQWQLSTDGGSAYTDLENDSTYQNVTTSVLTVKDVIEPMNGYTLRCLVGSCNSTDTSDTAKIIYCNTAYHVYVPNAFSPAGSQNPIFKLYGAGFKTVDFKIFDRWGELVFQTTDPSEGWTGTYRGKPMAPGLFVYMVNVVFLDDSKQSVKGALTLLR